MKRESGLVVGAVLVLYYIDRPGLVMEVAVAKDRLAHTRLTYTHSSKRERFYCALPHFMQYFESAGIL